ncbi:PREDICTED: synaptic vesicle glycoprotein 2B-like isoform X2 [Dufourea novaeangliae]|uniref:synaptic vesicle glycoprotein 2B-like isoform X2 n=1 Tax=Dufourea novaeangliae TaxID=178035 RepID=UPI0007677848|nr:PREDICTED: synaptic vesicle glycoprotein 2B-like isoform X2 [Dufourea novaeangliae]
MPSSEEESQWLVGSGGGPVSSGGGTISGTGERTVNVRGGLYTEEMTTQPANANTAGVNTASADSAEHDLIDSTADATLLAQFHEDAIKQAGVGYFQVLAAFCTGLSLAADTVEFFVVPYILPSAEVELCIEDKEKGWLSNITLMGLALGGLFWGGLGDRLGRRRSLLSAMSVHALFSGVATFMPTYGTFMMARFCSAIGVGGSLPLAFAYLAECCPRLSRGRWIGLLVAAGALGGVYAALLAWVVVPTTGEMVVLENKEHFSAWHRFLLLCCLPALCSTVGLIFIPESPRYLVEAGRDVEAMMVYQKIYKKNNARKGATGAQYQLSELELPSKRPRGLAPPSPTNHTSVMADIIYSIEMFWNSFLELFVSPHLRVSIVLIIIWSTVSFGLYGLMVWCPEYLKLIRATEYKAHTAQISGKEYKNETFTGSLENRQYRNATFLHCRFTKMIFSHVDFDNCTFQAVEFSNIKSSKTHFTNSTIEYSKFVDTDLSRQVFRHCNLRNNTELSLSGPCPTLDLDYNIYIEEALHGHLVAQLAFVPAAALAGLALTVLQRPKMIGISLFLSSVAATCLVLVGTNSSAVLGFEGGFVAIFAIAWTSLTLVTVESFPTHLRCTGFGFIAAVIRISGLIGTTTYKTLVGAPLIAPALLTALPLFIASLTTFKLPHTHTVFL